MKNREQKINFHESVTELLSYINYSNLGYPVYLEHIHCEEDCEQLGYFPVVYIWNNDRESGNFSVSVNGRAVGFLLESRLPRSNPKFNIIRDEVMAVLAQTAPKSVAEACEQMKMSPKDLFRPENAKMLLEDEGFSLKNRFDKVF